MLKSGWQRMTSHMAQLRINHVRQLSHQVNNSIKLNRFPLINGNIVTGGSSMNNFQNLNKIKNCVPEIQFVNEKDLIRSITQIGDILPTVEDNGMLLDSVLRKRRKKMKKHKLRKRRRKERAEKRKLSQGR
ncbi:hypothetical protein, no similarity [Maudiozyma saulgeensis]|uniref:Ribosomal protein mS38 C-terminal domain-containing protein n=1 Tax=Maudiozyma saulgeensis TaxID=1789683 RepID=A0A1X7R314_9SACH|nr:hypothetical protein, no similarity [Kazachstania saulgeensis]